MAKVGEGDERWIVKEREDGANVNGWHWSEKNLTDWAKERLTELLCDLVVLDDSTGSCKVCKLEKMVGDVTVQARKQKKFPLYELEITLNWEGQLFDAEARCSPLRAVYCLPCACRVLAACDGRGGCDSDNTAVSCAQGKTKVDAKGKVKIPDLSEETYDDLEMTVTVEEESDAKRALKEAVRLKGAPLIRNACLAFVKELKAPPPQHHALRPARVRRPHTPAQPPPPPPPPLHHHNHRAAAAPLPPLPCRCRRCRAAAAIQPRPLPPRCTSPPRTPPPRAPPLPSLRLPSLRLPSLRLPSLRLPSLRLPSLRLPSLRLPSLRLPSLRLPSLRLPSLLRAVRCRRAWARARR